MRFHRVKVLRRVPHPGQGFTQGLLAEPGDPGDADYTVLESTGQYGMSELRRYRLGERDFLAQAPLWAELFGEGICQAGDSIWQLTWRERTALRWDRATLELRDVIRYNREGWGICATGDGPGAEVVTSDGTSELVRRDPETLQPREVVMARYGTTRLRWLNDLAWSGGKVWANVACTNTLAGIDLATGEVTDLVDASAAADRFVRNPQFIMNGIAALPKAVEAQPKAVEAQPKAVEAQPRAAGAQPKAVEAQPRAAGAESEPGEFLLTGKGWRWIRQVRLAPARGVTPGRLLENAGRFR